MLDKKIGAYMNKFFSHLKTITKHKLLVTTYCFRAGLIKQGILHDLSKYSPSEFFPGVKYYQGTRSPIGAERRDLGYSKAWLHHKGRNKHHFEYWYDNMPDGSYAPIEMPFNYLCEMAIDRICACKTYQGNNYSQSCAFDYHEATKDISPLHENTRIELERILLYVKEFGEEKGLDLIKKELKEWRRSQK